MKKVFPILVCVLLLGVSCNQQSTELTDEQKAAIISEVENQYRNAVSDLSNLDMETWSQFYSKSDFISSSSMANYFSNINELIDTVTYWFSFRESQDVQIAKMNTTVLSSDMVLLTSIANWSILFKSGEQIKDGKVLTTLLWKKEDSGWKIICSHESWQNTAVE